VREREEEREREREKRKKERGREGVYLSSIRYKDILYG
jgi:hypothetical protein